VELNQAVAVGMARGPRAGLALIQKLEADGTLVADYRLQAVRANLQEMAGDLALARDSYIAAAERAPNLARQRYLNAQAARLMR
jgi:predicted RNA polymerase sigma factor